MKYRFTLLLAFLLTMTFAQEDVEITIEEEPSAAAAEADTVYVDEEGNPIEALPPIEKMPEAVKFVNAEYPEAELKNGLEGIVTLQIIISDSGSVDSISVLKSLAPAMDSAAVKALRQFKFSPALAGGVPIPVAIEYQYRFSLQKIINEIKEYVNLKGRLLEKGTRAPIRDGLVVVCFPDTVEDNTIKVPFNSYLRKIGGFEGQYLEENAIATVTDSLGIFQFKSLPTGPVRLTFPITGYKAAHANERIERGKQLEIDYRLTRESYDDYEIVVYGKVEKKEVAKRTLSLSEIKRVPGFGGDAIKVIRALPGVARTSVWSSDIIIRGSRAQDSRFFLDGVPIAKLFHFGGLRSVYSADLLSSISMYPGGFNSRYGNAIGGVVEVEGRPAKTDRWHGDIDINLLDAGLMLEGPLPHRLSMQMSGRYSYIGAIVGKIATRLMKGDDLLIPVYWNGQARLDWKPDKKNKFFLAYNTARDKLILKLADLSIGSREVSKDTNQVLLSEWYQMGVLGYDKAFHNSTINKFRISAVNANDSGGFFGIVAWKAKKYGVFVRDELSFALHKNLTVKAGGEADVKKFDIEFKHISDTGVVKSDRIHYSSIFGGYANLEYYPITSLLLKPGIRYDYYKRLEEGGASPRFTSRWNYRKGWTIKGAVGMYNQIPQPWLETTDSKWGNPDLPKTKAVHYVAGHEWQFADLISLDVQSYFNTQDDVPNPTDSANPSNHKDYNLLANMKSRMYGLEFMLRHDQGKRFFGWISYTLARSQRMAPKPFEEYEGEEGEITRWDPDKWVISNYDQTHNLQILGSWRLPRNWETGFRFRYVSGNPMTPRLSFTEDKFKYDMEEREYMPELGKVNSDRVRPFIQLDVRVEKKWIQNSWIVSAYLDVRNAAYFLYKSPSTYKYNYDGSDRRTASVPILPSLGISAHF